MRNGSCCRLSQSTHQRDGFWPLPLLACLRAGLAVGASGWLWATNTCRLASPVYVLLDAFDVEVSKLRSIRLECRLPLFTALQF